MRYGELRNEKMEMWRMEGYYQHSTPHPSTSQILNSSTLHPQPYIMAMEIERKFLIKKVPIDINQFPHQDILQ